MNIFILGAFRELNAGDDAVFDSMIRDLEIAIPGARFIVPSRCPHFLLEKYGDKYNIEIVSVTLKDIINLPSFIFRSLKSVYKSDVVLITQSFLYDYKLFNPKHNILFGILGIFIYTKFLRKKIGYYNADVGPLNTQIGRVIVHFMSNNVDFIILRNNEAFRILNQLNVTKPLIYVAADSALNSKPVPKEKAILIARKEDIDPKRNIGINVNFYIGTWVKSSIKEVEFIELISESADRIIEKLGVGVVFVTTNHLDIELVNRIKNRMRHQRNAVAVDNKKYNYQELMGIIGQLDIFIGMRLHSIVMAVAMNTPIIGIVYADKVRDFMKTLRQEDRVIEFKDLNVENLVSKAEELWLQREEVKRELKPVVGELQQKARQSAIILKQVVGSGKNENSSRI